MRNFDWEDNWDVVLAYLFILFCFVFSVIFIIASVSDHSVKSYYLSNINNELGISKEINWQFDETIELDRSITYDQAIELMNKLNESLKK